jgi:hypothetical protein
MIYLALSVATQLFVGRDQLFLHFELGPISLARLPNDHGVICHRDRSESQNEHGMKECRDARLQMEMKDFAIHDGQMIARLDYLKSDGARKEQSWGGAVPCSSFSGMIAIYSPRY